MIYKTKDVAEFKASTSHNLRGGFTAYGCKYGNHWHIGHTPPARGSATLEHKS